MGRLASNSPCDGDCHDHLLGICASRTFHGRGEYLSRHRHEQAYAAVVLSGTYIEAGDTGYHAVGPGDVLMHRAFEAHMNHFDHGPAEVLVLPWDEQSTLPLLGRIDDADRVVRAAETSVADAVAVLSGKIVERLPEARDWPHQLALDLQGIAHLRLSEWARDHGLHPGSLSRTFERIYGVTPARFRAEAKARRSHRNILAGAERLSEIALDSGFADQAHFSREFRKLTGLAPREFRKGLRVGRIESAFEECQGLIRCSDGLSSGLID